MDALDVHQRPSPATIAMAIPEFAPRSRDAFEQQYNRTSFLFHHELHEHELFTWPSLLKLGSRHPPREPYTYWANGQVKVNDDWGARGRPYSLRETLANIETNDSLVMFKHLEEDPVFAPFLLDVQRRILDLAGPRMSEDITCARGTILVASPWRITSYHIDADVNFLFQIAGDKDFRVFDPADRSVLPHQELENYFLGNLNGAVFKTGQEAQARRYDLRPGCGIHIPVITGHWAQNQGTPSVALSVNFDIASMVPLKRLYRVNGRLRKLGLNPKPPGASEWRDKLKCNAVEFLRLHRHLKKSEPS